MLRIAAIIAIVFACPAWAGREDRAKKAEQVWQMDRLLTVRIEISAQQWQMMQPDRASRLATAMAVPQHPTTQQALDAVRGEQQPDEKKKDPIEGEKRPPGLTGNQYAYVRATVKMDDQTYKNVGVRFKGQWSYSLAGAAPRRPLKLNFDHFVEGQDFQGVQSLSLNTNALDPSQLRESLGYAFFRDAGVCTPRTCFALVYLKVEGVYENELLGLYTAVEEINKDFLDRHFGTTKGLLIRPERTRNLAYFGSQWQEYDRYNIQTEATAFTAKRFMDFLRLVNLSSDEEFAAGIGTYLDTDQFLRFLAANVLMVNLDGVLVNGHNYYVHIHPTTGRIVFIPWDLHLGFGWHGRTLEEWAGLTIERPYRTGNRLVERVLAVEWMRERYRSYLREFATVCFASATMYPRIEQLEPVVRKAEAIARAQGKELPVSMPSGSIQPRAELKPFVTARIQSVLDQLAGKIEGDPVGGRPRTSKPAPAAAPKPPPPPVKVTSTPTTPAPKPPAPPEKATPASKPAPPPVKAPTTQAIKAAAPLLRLLAVAMTAAVAAPAASKSVAATTQPGRVDQRASATQPAAKKAAALTPPPKGTPPKKVVTPPQKQVTPPQKHVTPPPKPIRPAPPPRIHPLAYLVLNNIDCDRDGQLNRHEVADATKHLFMAHGRTGRSVVDEVSLAGTLDYLGGLLNPFPPSVDDMAPQEDPRRPRPALTWAAAVVAHADTAKKGHATLADLLAATERLFDQADANHDGLLSIREVSASMDSLLPPAQK